MNTTLIPLPTSTTASLSPCFKKITLACGLYGFAAKWIERGPDRESNRLSDSRLITPFRGWTVGDAGEHYVAGLLLEQFFQNFGAVTSAAAGRIVAGIGQNGRLCWCFHGPADTFSNCAGFGAELEVFAGVPIILREFERDFLLRFRCGTGDHRARGGTWFVSPHITDQ